MTKSRCCWYFSSSSSSSSLSFSSSSCRSCSSSYLSSCFCPFSCPFCVACVLLQRRKNQKALFVLFLHALSSLSSSRTRFLRSSLSCFFTVLSCCLAMCCSTKLCPRLLSCENSFQQQPKNFYCWHRLHCTFPSVRQSSCLVPKWQITLDPSILQVLPKRCKTVSIEIPTPITIPLVHCLLLFLLVPLSKTGLVWPPVRFWQMRAGPARRPD